VVCANNGQSKQFSSTAETASKPRGTVDAPMKQRLNGGTIKLLVTKMRFADAQQ
jgi:hypothetical protein